MPLPPRIGFGAIRAPSCGAGAIAWTLERLLSNPPLTVENVHGARLTAPCDLTALVRDFKPRLTPLSEGLRQALVEAA